MPKLGRKLSLPGASVDQLLTAEEKSQVLLPYTRRKSFSEGMTPVPPDAMGLQVSSQAKVWRRVSRKFNNEDVPADENAPLTVQEATFTWTSILLNFGLFSSPFLFSQNGLAALIMIFAAVAVCLATAVLLLDVLEEIVGLGVQRPGYGEIADIAVGRTFSRLMMIIGPFECFIYAIGNVMVLANTFSAALPGVSKQSLIIASCSLATLQSIIPDNIYAYFLLGGSLSITGVCAIVLAYGMALPTWADKLTLLENEGTMLPSCMTSCMFAIAAHCCVPYIFNSVGGDKGKCMKALGRGWMAYFILSCAFGVMGFYIYGSSVQVAATANVGLDLSLQPTAKGHFFQIPMNVLMLGRCQVGLVPVTRPVCDTISQISGRPQEASNGGAKVLTTAVPVFFFLGLAAYLLLDSLALLESLAGASVMSLNGFIFPGIVYMSLGSKVGFKRGVAVFAIGLGSFLSFAVVWKQFA